VGVLALLLAVGVLFGGVSLLGLPLLLVSVLAQGMFVVGLGMYCSLVCRSTFRATAMTVLVLLGVTVGHWIFYPLESTGSVLLAFHRDGLTPPCNLATFASLDHLLDGVGDRAPGIRLPAALAGTALYALLATLLWWRLRERFSAVTGRGQ
jgi:hypothetical protein